jgi:mycothiol system anti-sigma-R factor
MPPLEEVEVAVECRDVLERLDAYVDGELPPAETSAVRDHLATCASCREALEAKESLGKAIRQAPYYTAPAALKARIARSQPRARWTTGWIARAAVLLLAVAGAVIATRWLSAPSPIDTTANVVVDSHVRSLMGEHLYDVRSTDQHTVKPWFLGKIDFSPPVVDLSATGYPLVGGRLDYLAGRTAAALVYMRAQHTINVFIWPDSSASGSVESRSIRGFHVRHWTQAGMSFWVVSDLNDAELDTFVKGLRA